MTPEALTDSWLSSVLHTDVHVVGTSRIGDGLVGMNIRLELESDGSVPSSLIAKLPSPDPTSRATGIALRNPTSRPPAAAGFGVRDQST